jgi:hypothetical protein
MWGGVIELADEVELSETDYKLKYTGEEIDNILAFVKDFKTVYNKMKRVQAGCENISMTAAGMDVIKVIDFSIAFKGVPNIILIHSSANGKTSKAKVLNITSSNFKVQVVGNDNDTTTNLYWIATEQ